MRSAFGSDFDVPAGYVNTASIGIPPASAADAVAAAVDAWRRGGAVPPDFDAAVAAARAGFADLVGVPVARVASGAAVSQMLAPVAAALRPGTRVAVPEGEFTSATFPFAAQAARGVRVEEVPLARLAEAAHAADVVVASVVQSADGAIVDLAALQALKEGPDRLTVVLDVTQALGWMDLDVAWADVVVGGSYKWLLAPRGAAWMAVAESVPVVPAQAGWFAAPDPWDGIYGLPLRLAPDARALDISPAWFSQVGAAETLPWLAKLDRGAVHAHCAGLADAVRARLGMPPAGSAILAVHRPDAAERLRAAGVVSSMRAGGVRLAFHLYNTDDDVEIVLSALTS